MPNLLENNCECEQGEGEGLWEMKNNIELPHYHRDYYEKYLDVKDIPHFAVVRNPIDRFISASIRIVDDYGKNVDIDDNFLSWVLYSTDYHNFFKPQVDFISDKTHIWKYEDGMGKEFDNWLSGILGIDISFSIDKDVIYLQNPSPLESINPPKLRKNLKLIDNLKHFYRQDIEQFYPQLDSPLPKGEETKT